MKRALPTLLMSGLASLLVIPLLSAVQAQAGSATSFQLRQMEERYQRLAARVEELQLVQASLQQTVRGLTDKVRTLRGELNRGGADNVSREELSELAKELSTIDHKRRKDREDIFAALDEIRRLVSRPASTPVAKPAEKQSERSEKGYYYVIKEGDTISAVLDAYRREGVKGLTVEDVLRANPGLKPRLMPVGREVFIPDPES